MNNENFNGLTLYILASNETESLNETVDDVLKSKFASQIKNIKIVLKSKNCKSYQTAIEISEKENKIEIYIQKSENLVGCIGELPPLTETSHFIIMAGDGEMSPSMLDELIPLAKASPKAIITASKWLEKSEVSGYNGIKSFLNKSCNGFVSLLFKRKVTDVFSIFKIYPMWVYNQFDFQVKSYLYTSSILPLSQGVEYREIPTIYTKRLEGRSNFSPVYVMLVGIKFIYWCFNIKLKGRRLKA